MVFVVAQMFRSMADVLMRAPMCLSTADLSRAELHRRWADWKKEVDHHSQMGDYGTSAELQLLAKVIATFGGSITIADVTAGTSWRRGCFQGIRVSLNFDPVERLGVCVSLSDVCTRVCLWIALWSPVTCGMS